MIHDSSQIEWLTQCPVSTSVSVNLANLICVCFPGQPNLSVPFYVRSILHASALRHMFTVKMKNHIWEDFPRTDNSLSKCHKCLIFNFLVTYALTNCYNIVLNQ